MTLQLGEVREVGIEVVNQLGQDFSIDAAEYQIIREDNTEIDKGFPMISGHKILTLFNALEKGLFYVIFKYHIGAEILKAKIFMEVI